MAVRISARGVVTTDFQDPLIDNSLTVAKGDSGLVWCAITGGIARLLTGTPVWGGVQTMPLLGSVNSQDATFTVAFYGLNNPNPGNLGITCGNSNNDSITYYPISVTGSNGFGSTNGNTGTVGTQATIINSAAINDLIVNAILVRGTGGQIFSSLIGPTLWELDGEGTFGAAAESYQPGTPGTFNATYTLANQQWAALSQIIDAAPDPVFPPQGTSSLLTGIFKRNLSDKWGQV